jgi:hypothetical protein
VTSQPDGLGDRLHHLLRRAKAHPASEYVVLATLCIAVALMLYSVLYG